MNPQQLLQIIEKPENPKVEFKLQWYSSNRLDDRSWGEFLKDLISLANGNVGHVGETAYLIFGVEDKLPAPNQPRTIQNVPRIGVLSNLQDLRDTTLRKLRSACSPSPPDIKFDFVSIDSNKDLFVIEIPPSAGLIKLDRDLSTRGMCFSKGTVLIRVGQDVKVADPTEIAALERAYLSLSKPSPQRRKVLHNLPQPDYIRFVGRRDEINRLRKLLHPQDRIWTIVIDGVGGIGKSALALEVAHRYLTEFEALPEEERFEAIIWTSAKSTILTADGIVSRLQATRTIDDIYKAIANCLEEDDIIRAPYEDQGRLIYRALSRQRTLLIIDNLETIDDERVKAFIRELPAPTKCIVTTRHRIDIADPIRLTGMNLEDTLSLISLECSKKGVKLTQEEAELLFKRTGGIPLAVVWSISQMGYGYGVKRILNDLGNTKSDVAKFCFENAVTLIKTKPAYTLLVCICISTYVNNRDYLGQIAGFSELDRDEGLVELEKLSLINRQNNYYSVLPLVREYVLSRISDFPRNDLEAIIERISEHYGPAGSEAISLIKPFFPPDDDLVDVREKVANRLINQMYEWTSWGDDQGVSLCIFHLERLGTESAIQALRAVASGSLSMVWEHIAFADWEAINCLGRLGDIAYLADWLANGLPNAKYLKPRDVIRVIEQYGNIRIVPKLKEILSISTGEDVIGALQKAIETVSSRVQHHR